MKDFREDPEFSKQLNEKKKSILDDISFFG